MHQSTIADAEIVLSDDGHRAALNALRLKGGRWLFSPKEWVPDEYERLERIGLVHCEFGSSACCSSGLRAREISLTALGKRAADELGVVRMPSFVRYSFRSALNCQRKAACSWRLAG